MVIQNIVYENVICPYKDIYYRCEKVITYVENKMIVPERSYVSFYTYMNLFDSKFWKKYTTLSEIVFSIELLGKGTIVLKCRTDKGEVKIEEYRFDSQDYESVFEKEIELNQYDGMIYFDIVSDTQVTLSNAKYESKKGISANQDVRIALNICTYHRNREITRSISELRNSLFFESENELFGKLSIVVIDNGSELKEIDTPHLKIVHNHNCGGSGGFTRGLQVLNNSIEACTNIVFMDDDVEFLTESLYRLYALLICIKKQYRHEPIAGRMFRTDHRQVQYTAAEIWNGGNIVHVGHNVDVTKESDLFEINNNQNAEYGGWWFCCYPYEFARENVPLPFFIHCDDVEYGLRHGGVPIILNGIQVWHETYEYRQSPVIAYYDMRNSMIVNAIYGLLPDKETLLVEWKNKISEYHVRQDYLTERMLILAMYDFLKGKERFLKRDLTVEHRRIARKRHSLKLVNAILWRITNKIFIKKYQQVRMEWKADLK